MKLPEISKQVLYYKVFIVSSYVVTSKITLAPSHCENAPNIPQEDSLLAKLVCQNSVLFSDTQLSNYLLRLYAIC